jgi:hypothetical protein
MAALEMAVSSRIAGDPAYVGYADDIAVQVIFENACASGRAERLHLHMPKILYPTPFSEAFS